MKIIFILNEPAVPENVGAAARALKTMGFEEMRIVNSDAHKKDKAHWLAHGAVDVLESAYNYNSLQDAVKDIDILVGTTAKNRSVKHDYYTPGGLKDLLHGKREIAAKAGILFGKEESGLSNEELALCHIASTIPLKTIFPSLNLAQCVMLYAYELSNLMPNNLASPPGKDHRLFAVLNEKVEGMLSRLDFVPTSSIYNRILERLALLNEDDVRLVLSVLEKMDKK